MKKFIFFDIAYLVSSHIQYIVMEFKIIYEGVEMRSIPGECVP